MSIFTELDDDYVLFDDGDYTEYGTRSPTPDHQQVRFDDEYLLHPNLRQLRPDDPHPQGSEPPVLNPDEYIEDLQELEAPLSQPASICIDAIPDTLPPVTWPGEYGQVVPTATVIKCAGCDNMQCISQLQGQGIWTLSEEEALCWFRNHNLLFRSRICDNCKTVAVKDANAPIAAVSACPTCKCKVFHGPPLMDAYQRFSARQALLFIVAVARRDSVSTICNVVGISRPTVIAKKVELWSALADYNWARAKLVKVMIAQADETCFGKNKYNRGKRVNNHLWFQSLVAVDENGRTIDAFLRPVPNRRAVTLIPFLRNALTAQSTCVTDEYGSYNTMCEFTNHETVCHKYEFKNSEGYHTNNAEGYHGLVKREIALRGRRVGQGFVNRARFVTAMAEMTSAHIRGVIPEVSILNALLLQVNCFAPTDVVGRIVRAWDKPVSPIQRQAREARRAQRVLAKRTATRWARRRPMPARSEANAPAVRAARRAARLPNEEESTPKAAKKAPAKSAKKAPAKAAKKAPAKAAKKAPAKAAKKTPAKAAKKTTKK